MTPVGCFKCHKLMRLGDEAFEVAWPAVSVSRDGTVSPRRYVRYLCPDCGVKPL